MLSKLWFEGLALGMVGWGGSSVQDLEVWVLCEPGQSRTNPRHSLVGSLGEISSKWFVEEWG